MRDFSHSIWPTIGTQSLSSNYLSEELIAHYNTYIIGGNVNGKGSWDTYLTKFGSRKWGRI